MLLDSIRSTTTLCSGVHRAGQQLCPESESGVASLTTRKSLKHQGEATQGQRHLAFWEGKLKAPSFVYVIQGDEGTPVKIGTSRNPAKRLASLQTASWQPLRLLHVVPGDRHLEHRFHVQLADCKVNGEWYEGPNVQRFLEYVGNLAERMVAEHDGGLAPSLSPHSDRLENPEFRDRRWRVISDMWLAGHGREAIGYVLYLEPKQLEAEIERMRSEGGYELPEGMAIIRYGTAMPCGDVRRMGGWHILNQPKKKRKPAPVTVRFVDPKDLAA